MRKTVIAAVLAATALVPAASAVAPAATPRAPGGTYTTVTTTDAARSAGTTRSAAGAAADEVSWGTLHGKALAGARAPGSFERPSRTDPG
ncbi:hypothetical protein, partial [Streptomyces sp. NPDC002690]